MVMSHHVSGRNQTLILCARTSAALNGPHFNTFNYLHVWGRGCGTYILPSGKALIYIKLLLNIKNQGLGMVVQVFNLSPLELEAGGPSRAT